MIRSTSIHRHVLTAVAAAVLAAAGTAAAQPVSKAFTYQGQLLVSGQPANGLYDVRFELYSVATGGSPMQTIVRNGVDVAGGLISERVDFGYLAFTGEARWIQVSVKPAGGGTFTPLIPRQSVTAAPMASGLAVPIWTQVASTPTLFVMRQQGDGECAVFEIDNSSNGNVAMTAGTSGTGFAASIYSIHPTSTTPALNAIHTGRGPAGRFTTNSNAGASAAVEAINQGIGTAVKGTANNIGAGVHAVTLSSTTGQGLVAASHGSVSTIAALVSHHNNGTALRATTAGSGTVIEAVTAGTGTSVRAQAGNGLGVWASTTGVGTAIRATAEGPAGMGVYSSVTGNGTAMRASTGAGGTSLLIEGGSVRVGGAGINTQTAVFRHRVTASTINGCIGTMCKSSRLDHPMLNGNPNAMVFITEVMTNVDSFNRTVPVGVRYNSNEGRWHIRAQGDSVLTVYEDLDEGQEFNMMIVLPF
jgi:hypothetical protein